MPNRVKRALMNLNSLMGRMILSHVLVAVITILLTYIVLPIQQAFTTGYDEVGYRGVAMSDGIYWMFPNAFDEPIPHYPQTAGFSLVVSPTGEVVYVTGDAPCQHDQSLSDCAPALASAEDGSRAFERDGVSWNEVVLPTATGHRLISQRAPYAASGWEAVEAALDPQWLLRVLRRNGVTALLLAIPMALIVVWFMLRPKIKRIEHVVNTSKVFAAGDLSARALDRRNDDVGEWALRFDEMADALAQNITTLRDLAQRNAELVQQIEQNTIQQERLRLSRDLHDSVAQRLFSLTVSTRGLPDMLRKEPERGIVHAQSVAKIAQQALLDLRALLVDLRPSNVIQYGLGEAIRQLCDEYEISHTVCVECSVMLFGRHIPAPVQDALYRITQEALSNAAKHAQASVIAVSLVQGQKQIILSVTDDGIGMDTTAVGNGRMGLHTMRERALAVGGDFEIESASEQGTTVRVRLPLSNVGEEAYADYPTVAG